MTVPQMLTLKIEKRGKKIPEHLETPIELSGGLGRNPEHVTPLMSRRVDVPEKKLRKDCKSV